MLPKMKEANAVLLMDKFIYYLKQHRLYTRTRWNYLSPCRDLWSRAFDPVQLGSA